MVSALDTIAFCSRDGGEHARKFVLPGKGQPFAGGETFPSQPNQYHPVVLSRDFADYPISLLQLPNEAADSAFLQFESSRELAMTEGPCSARSIRA